MTMRRFWRWVGIAAQLYVLFTAIFLTFNIGTIVLIRGWEPLTPDVLYYIFARDAIMSIGLAALGCVFMAFFLRSLRRKRA
jgi:hypothetical protein